jgi:Heterokaryon incompatibility protein (HET)
MRLINSETLDLQDFQAGDHIPHYAILSHTWGAGEVAFQDWHDREKAAQKPGFVKIQRTCQLALLDGYTHVWVDTNCIDKSSSAELSESINSI